jgi:hypothetical protein
MATHISFTFQSLRRLRATCAGGAAVTFSTLFGVDGMTRTGIGSHGQIYNTKEDVESNANNVRVLRTYYYYYYSYSYDVRDKQREASVYLGVLYCSLALNRSQMHGMVRSRS